MFRPHQQSAPIEVFGRSDDSEFEEVVFREELAYQRKRRAHWEDERPAIVPSDGLTVHQGLVGLAFSGGGIRSATFNLGLAQALHRRGVFRLVDYLSTVSGGGYVGTALSSWLRAPPADATDPFPFPIERSAEEPPLLAYIRNHANYLTPQGPISVFLLLSVLFRGITLNLLVLAPVLVATSLLIALLFGTPLRDGAQASDMMVGIPVILGISLGAFLLHPLLSLGYRVRDVLRLRAGRPPVDGIATRDLADWLYTVLFVVVLAVLALDLQPLVLERFHQWHSVQQASLLKPGLAATLGGAISTLTALGVFRRQKITRPLLLFVGLMAGTLVPYLLFLLLTEGLVYSDAMLEGVLKPAEYLGMLLVPDAIELVDIEYRMIGVGLLGVALLVGGLLIVDVNVTGMSAYYRDRLSRVFVVSIKDGKLGPSLDMPLSELCPDDSGAPYHIVNTAMNLQASTDPDLRGRNAGFFMFSRFFSGGRRSGWCRTEDLEGTSPWMHLGTAMAISGAAASPNMGSLTQGALVPLLALLNVRLGVWVPHPRHVRKEELEERPVEGLRTPSTRRLVPFRADARYLLREMIGRLHARAKAVYLSDGGHLENLGAVELLRRRCRLIIVGDGEADPEMSMRALATLSRYARIDLGIEIDVDVSGLRLKDDGLTDSHTIVGRIRYPGPGDETGWLLYVKASVTGDEELIVDQYRRAQPAFPHQTTADQFFDETQFEAYRSLGVHAMESFFEGIEAMDTAEHWDLRMLLKRVEARWIRTAEHKSAGTPPG